MIDSIRALAWRLPSPVWSLPLLLFLVLSAVFGPARSASPGDVAQGVQAFPVTLSEEIRQQWISAIGNDRVAMLRQLLRRSDASRLITLSASNGKNALMVASKKGDLSLVRSLVAAGSRIDARTATNGTAFMFAVLGGQQQVAQWLLERGADPHVVGANGWTALTLAVARGDETMVDWLLANGADAQVRDVYRFTPFMRAVENGRLAVARRLLELDDTDIDARDEYGNTALHHAVAAADASMVAMLLAQGASPDIRNRDGTSPATLARQFPSIQALLP